MRKNPITLASVLLVAAGLASPLVFVARVARAEGDAGAPSAEGRERLEGEKLDALLADIAKARKNVKTLKASFTQERRLSLLATTVKSSGDMAFVAPDRLKWALGAPDDVTYFIGPEGLTYRTKSGSQTAPAGSANVTKGLTDLKALLGGDLAVLKDRYTLTGSRGTGDVEVSGTAKDPKAAVRAFTLVLDKTMTLPAKARLLEGKSDSVDIVFSNAVANAPIDPKEMRP